jgi:hypothetical protein
MPRHYDNDFCWWTGLPAGPEHDRVSRDGDDYFVVRNDDETESMEVFPATKESCDMIWKRQDDDDKAPYWNAFSLVRAMSEADAIARFLDVNYLYMMLDESFGGWEGYVAAGGKPDDLLNMLLRDPMPDRIDWLDEPKNS